MPAYSDSKNSPKRMPVYSVMWPKMISESAIGMSNGGRESSARLAITKMMNPAIWGKTNQYDFWASTMPTSDSVPACIETADAARTKGSSYAISCAAPRIAPISENLFALAQPAINMPITLIALIASTKKTPTSKFSPQNPQPPAPAGA